jgi:hypothetical protein
VVSVINDAGMSDTTKPDDDTTHEMTPKDELTAALAHLRSAADLIARRIDPAVRKAAADAEKAIERAASETERTASEIGAAAKPFATKVGTELGRLADEIKKSVAHLEQAAQPKEKPAGEAKKKDPDDPGSLR